MGFFEILYHLTALSKKITPTRLRFELTSLFSAPNVNSLLVAVQRSRSGIYLTALAEKKINTSLNCGSKWAGACLHPTGCPSHLRSRAEKNPHGSKKTGNAQKTNKVRQKSKNMAKRSTKPYSERFINTIPVLY